MTLSTLLLTPTNILLVGAVWAIIWQAFKKEIIEYGGSTSKRLWVYFFSRGIVRKLTQKELDLILKANLGRVNTLLLVLAKEWHTDRITVMRYDKKGGAWLATCLVQVREAEMQSVEELYQNTPVDPAIVAEVLRIHNLPGRNYYVPDARLVDIAAMQAALLASDVRSAYYQSMPNSKGELLALLAISWRTEHPLSEKDLHLLYYSGLACAAVFSSTESMNQTTST